MKMTRFSLEPLEGQSFEGFTSGHSWNGWACPLFSKAEADRVVRAWNALGYKADYDPATDRFRFAPIDKFGDSNPDLSDEEMAEHFGPVVIDGMTLYPVGAGAWIWEESNGVSVPAGAAQLLSR